VAFEFLQPPPTGHVSLFKKQFGLLAQKRGKFQLRHPRKIRTAKRQKSNQASVLRDESARFKLALSLLVTRISADHINLAFSTDYFAIFANSLDASADFHRSLLTFNRSWLKPISI
jgi:hypothetical protein